MSLETWLLFLTLEMALSLSPGPAVFYVVSQGVRAFPRALPATLGILSANGIYFALSSTGLGMLIATSARFFTIVKWAGAAYLIWLAIKSLRSAASTSRVSFDAAGMTGAAGSTGEGARHSSDRRQNYLGALTLQLSNPKALLTFLALLPQFIDTQKPMVPQISILAATSMLPEFCILLSYGWLANRAARASARFGMTRALNRSLAWIEGLGLLFCATLVLRFSKSD